MNHKRLPIAVAALALLTLAGCATPPPPAPERDKIGEIIAKYAESATASLRTLSENEGGTRSVQLQPAVTPAPAAAAVPLPGPIGAYTAPLTREGSPATQIIVVPYPAPAPAPAPAAAPAPAPAAAPAAPSVTPASPAAAATVKPLVRSADRIIYGAGGVTGGADVLGTIPTGLERRITLADVTDDVEGLVERISRQVGWIRLPSTGIRVSQQPWTVNAVDRPAIEVIRDISGAVGRNAEIVVTPGNKTLSVQFPVR